MKVIRQHFIVESSISYHGAIHVIADAARTCYKSEGSGIESDIALIKGLIKSGHHSVLEHVPIRARIITNRGVTHEIVRHRLAAYSQESTRYCNYSKGKFGREITVILPVWFYDIDDVGVVDSVAYRTWKAAMEFAEESYFELLESGQSPQQAREVLNNAQKTEIYTTYNIREWRHFFTLRAAPIIKGVGPHPQMQDVARSILRTFITEYTCFFEDLSYLLEE